MSNSQSSEVQRPEPKEFLPCSTTNLELEENLKGEPLLYYARQEGGRILLGTALSVLSIEPDVKADAVYSITVGGRKFVFGDVTKSHNLLDDREQSTIIDSKSTYENLYIRLATEYREVVSKRRDMAQTENRSQPVHWKTLGAKLRFLWLAKKDTLLAIIKGQFFTTYDKAKKYILGESAALLQKSFDSMQASLVEEIAERSNNNERWDPYDGSSKEKLFIDGYFSELAQKTPFIDSSTIAPTRGILRVENNRGTVRFVVTSTPDLELQSQSARERKENPAIIIYSPLALKRIEKTVNLGEEEMYPQPQRIVLGGNPPVVINIKNTPYGNAFISVDSQLDLLAVNNQFDMQQFIANSRGELLVQAIAQELADVRNRFLIMYFHTVKNAKEMKREEFDPAIVVAGMFSTAAGIIAYTEFINRPATNLIDITAFVIIGLTTVILEHTHTKPQKTNKDLGNL